VNNFLRDAAHGLRVLRRNPGFAVVAVLALALGIGANSAIFSVIYGTLLAPLPYHDGERIAVLWSTYNGNRNVTSVADYLDWKRLNTTFEALCTGNGADFNLTSGDHPERISGTANTPGCTDVVFGEKPLLGRYFVDDDAQAGRDHVVVLYNSLWRERFQSDPNIVGKQLTLNGESYTVVGVRPPGTGDKEQTRLMVPMIIKPSAVRQNGHQLLLFGRMKPGVTLAQANADLSAISAHLAEMYPDTNANWGAKIEPLKNDFLGDDTIRALWMLMGAVGFVLLIACANVANLLLSRATTREKEVAVRASLGADRGTLFRQFLTESLTLALAGGIAGVVLAAAIVRVINVTIPAGVLPNEATVSLNLPVLAFTFVCALIAGVMFGCAPAFQASRMNINESLKAGGRSDSSMGRYSIRRVLIVAEFALALSLLAGGGMAMHSLWNTLHIDLGFRTDHLLTFYVPVPHGRLTDPAKLDIFYDQVAQRLRTTPGVESVSVSTGMPLTGFMFGNDFQVAGHEIADHSRRPNAGFNMVSTDYFQTFGIPIVKGRAFTIADNLASPRVAMINETLANRVFKDTDPIGQRIIAAQIAPESDSIGAEVPMEIVGVYRDVHNRGLGDELAPEIDLPFAQSPWPQSMIAIRTSSDPGAMSKTVAGVVQGIDSMLPIARVRTMDQILDEGRAGERFSAFLFGSFAALALLLATVGIYGVMSFAVAQRTHEIGMRMALGAGYSRILALILKEGLLLAGIGLVIGSFGAFAVGRAMQSLFYKVGAMDLVAFSSVAALLLGAALLACFIPARRAATIDPMQALRGD
jgi:putative ABC transport system permease protein